MTILQSLNSQISQLGSWLHLSDTQVLIAKIGLVILCVAIVLWAIKKVIMSIRGLLPTRINPKLSQYAGDADPQNRRRREMAATIKSTSSTDQVPGYKILQAVEALYVDGFRTPVEALEGLKAAAAERGANAIINVRHERSSLGRCSASGDAVVVETTAQVYTPPTRPIEIVEPDKPQKIERKKPDGPMIR